MYTGSAGTLARCACRHHFTLRVKTQNSFLRKLTPFTLLLLTFLPLALLTGCGTPSVGVGVGIPHTPIGVGVGVPLWDRSTARNYRALMVESNPSGAEVFLNNAMVGITPLTVHVPFGRGFWGNATGSASIGLRKPGYASAGRQLFPAGGRIATSPGGNPIDKLEFSLQPE